MDADAVQAGIVSLAPIVQDFHLDRSYESIAGHCGRAATRPRGAVVVLCGGRARGSLYFVVVSYGASRLLGRRRQPKGLHRRSRVNVVGNRLTGKQVVDRPRIVLTSPTVVAGGIGPNPHVAGC